MTQDPSSAGKTHFQHSWWALRCALLQTYTGQVFHGNESIGGSCDPRDPSGLWDPFLS